MSRIVTLIACVLAWAGQTAWAQSHPTPLALPTSQNWGSSGFSIMPAGFATWGGLSGSSVSTQSAAETSSPNADATLLTSTPTNGGTGGSYGYAVSGNARFAVLTSSNSSTGVNQLVLALNTTGRSNIQIAFDYINVVANLRTVGAVVQYRLGTAGAWTTVISSGNPYVQSGGTAGTITPVGLTLPSAADNQPIVQVRWAVWRGTEGGSSSGFAVDNLSITGTLSGGPPAISSVSLPGSSFNLNDNTTVTVQLGTAPPAGSPATVSIASGAFATSPVNVVISDPQSSGSANVTLSQAGTWTAQATAVSGCTGDATSSNFTVVNNTPQPPTAYAGADRTVTLSGGSAVVPMTGATGDDPNGLAGVTYAWTPISGAGLVGWTARTGSVATTTSPANATVTLNTAGVYVFTLTVTDAGTLFDTDTVAITVQNPAPPTDPYDPPANYYDPARPGGVWYTGSALKTALNGIIDSHTVISYDDLPDAYVVTDRDPLNASKIILVYNGASVSNSWNGTWNREHMWPDSLNGSGAVDSDLFNVRPCNPDINNDRGNDPYGIGSGYFDPNQGATDRGDSARAMFYVATRYTNLTLVNGQPGSLEMGDLAKLLEWHYADPVNTAERRRNHLIFSSTDNPSYHQGNRNPFVDHPELVNTIFGDGSNDSRIYLGTTPPADSTTTQTVNFGRLNVGATPPGQNVTLRKSGTDPAYYSSSVSGLINATLTGRYNVFQTGTQSATVTVSLAAGATSTTGYKTGTVTIDNLETTQAGTGTGNLDGNDAIYVVALVLQDCPNPVFDADSDGDVDQRDFGAFQRCYSGDQLTPAGCECYDRDVNLRIDTDDLNVFLGCASGPHIPANSACDD